MGFSAALLNTFVQETTSKLTVQQGVKRNPTATRDMKRSKTKSLFPNTYAQLLNESLKTSSCFSMVSWSQVTVILLDNVRLLTSYLMGSGQLQWLAKQPGKHSCSFQLYKQSRFTCVWFDPRVRFWRRFLCQESLHLKLAPFVAFVQEEV